MRFLSDNAEIGRLDERDPTVSAVGVAGDEGMYGAEFAKARHVLGHVVDLAIGDQHRPGDPVARDIRHQAFEGTDEVGAVGAAVGLDDPDFKRSVRVHFRQELLAHGLGDLGTLAEAHALRAIDNQRGDRGQRLALLADIGGIGQGGSEGRQGSSACQPGPAAPAQIGEIGQRAQDEQREQDRPAEQRVEAYASSFGQLGPPSGEGGILLKSNWSGEGVSPVPSPRRSSKAGRWTWSSL